MTYTHISKGFPNRPENGTVKLGDKTIKLPTIHNPINSTSLRVFLKDIIGNRLYEKRYMTNQH